MSYVTGPSGAAGPLSVAPTGTLTATSIATAGLAVSGAGDFAANVSCANLQCNGWLTGNGALLTGIAGAVTVNASIEANGLAARLTNRWVSTHGNLLSGAVLSAVAWSPTLNIFAAVGNGGVAAPNLENSVYSSPDGLTWTPRNSGYTEWNGIAWGGNKFVAVGDNLKNPAIATSTDGVNWTVVLVTAALGATVNLTSVVWSPARSQFVAVSNGIGKGSAVSPDGINWTYNTSAPALTYGWASLVWADSLGKYVALASTNHVMTSPDGSTWTLTATLAGGFVTSTLAWSPALGLLVALNAYVWLSNDGVTWTKYYNTPQTLATKYPYATAWVPDNGGFFVCISNETVGANTCSGAVSKDGMTWVPFFDPVPAVIPLAGVGCLLYSSSLKRLMFVSSSMGAVDMSDSISDTYVSNASGFFGVGTSTPTQMLDVAGYVRTQHPAFMAIGTETAAVTGTNMSFANVVVNVGNCYSTGFFTCGASGVHNFTASASIAPGSALWLNKTGAPNMPLGKASNTGNSYVYVSVSATAPLQLMEQVSVQCVGGSGLCDSGSVFSGAMLFAT